MNALMPRRLPANRFGIRAAGADHDVDLDVFTCKRQKSRESTARQVHPVGAAKKNQNVPNRAFPSPHLVVQLAIDRLQKHVLRPQHQSATFSDSARVACLHLRDEVLVKQDVARMISIGKIIDDHDAPH